MSEKLTKKSVARNYAFLAVMLGSMILGSIVGAFFPQVKEGDEVKVNQPLMIVEAMKMETTFVSKVNGKVDKLYVAPGDRVNTEDLLVSFILDEEE